MGRRPAQRLHGQIAGRAAQMLRDAELPSICGEVERGDVLHEAHDSVRRRVAGLARGRGTLAHRMVAAGAPLELLTVDEHVGKASARHLLQALG